MKRSLTIAIVTMFSMACMAQSSEAGYPVGTWQSNPDGNEAFVDVTIDRVSNPDPNFGNKKSCGVLSIDGQTPYDAMMTYAGRALDKNGMGVDIFYFNVINKQNKTSRIGIKKLASTPNEFGNGVKINIVNVTGDLANNPAMKQQLYAVGGGNGAAYDPTPFILTDKELLNALQEGVGESWTTRGFGNARQYIAAHAKLTPGKPKYAKCKGTGSINIRESGDAKAEKIGELKPGTTLPVVDEYDGWCQVRLSEKQFGWISQSVLTLTNIEGTSAYEPSYPPTVDGHVAFLGIPLNVTPAKMKDQLLAKGFKVSYDDGGNNISLTGQAYGTKSRVIISIGFVNGKNGCIYSMMCLDEKTLRLPQAKARYNQLVKKMESIYGKGTATNDYSYEINVGKGKVSVSYFNEDEMDGASDFYVVQTFYQDFSN